MDADVIRYIDGRMQRLDTLLSQLQSRSSRIHIVEGTPEGAEVAPVGHIALRSDGGAGTVLYVKESGSGDTGWVGK